MDITEVRLNDVDEEVSLCFIILLEELSLRCFTDNSLDNEEETADVDTIECRSETLCSLITVENYALTRERDDGVNASSIQTITLSLVRSICKFDCISQNATLETCRREPRFCNLSSLQAKTSNVTVARYITIDIIILIVDVLVTRIKYQVRRTRQLINCLLYTSDAADE